MNTWWLYLKLFLHLFLPFSKIHLINFFVLVERLPGKYRDTYRYFYDGYMYHKEKPRNKNPTRRKFDYYRCEQRNQGRTQRPSCPGLLIKNLTTGVLGLKKDHFPHEQYHAGYPLEVKFQNRLEELVKTTVREFQDIFDSLKAKYVVQHDNNIILLLWKAW